MSFFPSLAAPEAPPLWRGAGLAADTHVATPRGAVAAGALAIGDVIAAAGGGRLVVTGARRMSLAGPKIRRLGLPPPVLLEAGALGLGRPRFDLVLGPAQAVRLGGHSVPADALVDGVAIRRLTGNAELVDLRFKRPGAFLVGGVALDQRCCRDPAVVAEALLALPRIGKDGPLEGHVDHADRFGVVGWVRDVALPEAAIPLEIVVDGRVMARLAADRPRPDLVLRGLARAGDAVARHGFAARFATPLPAGRAWLISVRHAGGGAGLPGSPLLVDGAGGTPERFDMALAGLAESGAAGLAALMGRAAEIQLRTGQSREMARDNAGLPTGPWANSAPIQL